MKRAMITGATGAIGTALLQTLIAEGIEVLVFCRPNSNRKHRIPEHPLVTIKYADLTEFANVENDTGKTYDVLYHFAWAGTTGQGRNDMHLQEKNIQYALDAVDMAARFGCTMFVGAGSQAEYGRFEGRLKPDTPAFPENGYGIAKLCAGQMTREHASQLGMRHAWIRILSVYGPNDGMQSMIMSTIDKIKKGEVPSFTKGEQLWDYLYSYDAAKAFYMVGQSNVDRKIYVLGSGTAKRLCTYIEQLRDAVNPDAELNLGGVPYAPKQVMHLEADISVIQEDTGWSPETSFEDGITKTVESLN